MWLYREFHRLLVLLPTRKEPMSLLRLYDQLLEMIAVLTTAAFVKRGADAPRSRVYCSVYEQLSFVACLCDADVSWSHLLNQAVNVTNES